MNKRAVVIGSGPNGLSAAIVLARAGLDVEVREAAPVAGGSATSAPLTLPGFMHDPGSAVHPMAISSPFFSSLPLHQFGLRWIFSPAELAHPLDDGTAVTLERDLDETASQCGRDAGTYRKLFRPFARNWGRLFDDVFRPLGFPQDPVLLARFGIFAIQPCTLLVKTVFRGARARAIFAGSAAHSMLKLESPLSSAFGLVFGSAGHAVGWPIAAGGTQSISDALVGVLGSFGGRVVTNSHVNSLDELGSPELTLCDITPLQFLAIAGNRLKPAFQKLLRHFKYGPGAFKVDYALSEPIPWKASQCRRAITVHVGGTLEEISASERAVYKGRISEKPFVLLSQPSLFDTTRAPAGKHTAWAYCHVPNGWRGSALDRIEAQIERFAPGFRDCVLARAVRNTSDLQRWNENLIGGDVNGGALSIGQFVSRPT